MRTTEFFSKLKEENLSHLGSRTGVSRQALHNAVRSHNMQLENVESVAKAMHLNVEFVPDKTEDNLLASLARFDVPVAHTKDGNLEFGDVVKESLGRSRKDGAYETYVPFLLAKNASKVDPLKLAAKAFEVGQVNVLGYFVEMARVFRPHSKFDHLLKLLAVAKNPQNEFLVLTEKTHFPELFEKNKLALKWNLKVRGTVDDHMQRWEKWAKSQKKN